MAGVVAGAVVSFNTLFFLASYFYYADKAGGDAGAVRFAFALLSLIVAIAAYGAALAPRPIGHVLAVVFGVASLVGAIAGFASGKPPVMSMTLLIMGGLLPVLAWQSWLRSRPAWSFLISIIAVFAIVTFFGAPKVRNLLHIGLWHALILPGLLIVCVIALAMVRDEYRTER